MADEDTIVVAGPQHRKRSYHIWTHEQRVCVYMLSQEFHHLNITTRAKVFNEIFETKLAACNISYPGISPGAIYLAYWKSTAPGMAARQPWREVYLPSDTVKEHTMRGSMRARIASVLSSNGIEFVWVGFAETAPSTPSEQNALVGQAIEKRRRSAAILTTPPSTADDGEDDDEEREEDDFDRHYLHRKKIHHYNQRYESPFDLVSSFTGAPDSHDLVDSDEPLTQASISPTSLVTPRGQPIAQRANPCRQFISEARSEMLSRRNMVPIPVTPEKARAAQAPFREIPADEAHPPLSRFLFRAFTTKSQGLNSANGFVCGRCANARVAPTGPPKSPDWDELLEHLDPSKTLVQCQGCQKSSKCCKKILYQKMSSSYISFSSDLIWVIRKMISQGDQSSIGIVDTSTLDPLSVFYVPPYQQELARKHLFHGREHRYKGYSEHLVYQKVPGSAVVKTFSYQELVAFAETDGLTRKTLRLPELRLSGTSSTEILKTMKQSKLGITPQVAVIIAKLVMFLGIDSNASMSKLAFLVYKIVRGWALRIAETTTTERSENTDKFMDTFYRDSDRVLSGKDCTKLKYA